MFGLQGMLAWFIALPLLPAIMVPGGIGILEILATGLWLLGFSFESIGDYQLSKFKRDANSKGRVLESGLWRYTRHPNYFGDFCIWWAFYLFAVAAGGWWTVISPLLMSFLLLKVSGVAMLEKTIGERRPDYASYIRRTNAFFPGIPFGTIWYGPAKPPFNWGHSVNCFYCRQNNKIYLIEPQNDMFYAFNRKLWKPWMVVM